jgi:hypothetical protein
MKTPSTDPRATPVRALAAPLAAVAASVALGGCYRHVVGVKGSAAPTVEIHEANIQPGESVWDNAPRKVEQDMRPPPASPGRPGQPSGD